jgi:hypothetical protein
VVDFYEDAGISRSNGREKRPGLDRLLKDATARRINMIAAWSVDCADQSQSEAARNWVIGNTATVHWCPAQPCRAIAWLVQKLDQVLETVYVPALVTLPATGRMSGGAALCVDSVTGKAVAGSVQRTLGGDRL